MICVRTCGQSKGQRGKLTTLLIAGILAFGISVPPMPAVAATSSSVQSKLDQATKSKKENLAKLNEAKEQKKGQLAEKSVLESEIDILESELSQIDSIIDEAETRIAEKEQEITGYETQIQENDGLFRQRLRAMDESNVTNYIDILLKASSFSDFLARIETINEISAYDQGIIDQMISLKNGVIASKQQVEADKAEQEDARSLVADKKSALDAKVAQKNKIISELESDAAKYEKAYNEAQDQEAALKKQLQSMLSSSSGGGGSYQQTKFVGGVFLWPMPASSNITSEWGYRTHPILGTTKYHSGMDIACPTGSSVLAANAGVVTLAGWNGGYGYCVVIDHGGGLATLYGHNSSLAVSAGQRVTKGQTIARSGSTGMSTGPHLHFEVLKNGSSVNPRSYVSG